eukprot:5765745-Alexandrium_andersonii.AAC.1
MGGYDACALAAVQLQAGASEKMSSLLAPDPFVLPEGWAKNNGATLGEACEGCVRCRCAWRAS